jgi:hypothetical protein
VSNHPKALVLCVLLLLLLPGLANATQPLKIPYVTEKLIIDGIAEGYPEQSMQVGKAEVKVAVWEDRIYVHVKATGNGWIAIGFNKLGKGMDGSNLIIGYLDSSGKAAVRNDIGKGWSHSAAIKQGVIEFGVKSEGGSTLLEFSYPLVFEKGYGLNGLEKGLAFTLIVAANDRSFSLTSKHSWRATVDLTL